MVKSLHLKRVSINSDEIKISSLLYTPNLRRSPYCVVLSHGLTASKESMDVIACYLADKGFPTITHDFRGHKLGASMGELHGVTDLVRDTVAVCNFAMDQTESQYVIPIGHSMGGIVSLAVMSHLKNAIGVGVIAAGPEPLRGFQGMAGQALLKQRTDYVEGISPESLLRELGELYSGLPPFKGAPALFVAAKGDAFAKSNRMREMSEAYGEYATYMEVDGSHLEAPLRSRGVVTRWLESTFDVFSSSRDKTRST